MSGPEEAVLPDVSQYPHVRLSWETIRQLNDYWKKCTQSLWFRDSSHQICKCRVGSFSGSLTVSSSTSLAHSFSSQQQPPCTNSHSVLCTQYWIHNLVVLRDIHSKILPHCHQPVIVPETPSSRHTNFIKPSLETSHEYNKASSLFLNMNQTHTKASACVNILPSPRKLRPLQR